MLGARVLREAEKPSGNADALADSRDVQPASDTLFVLLWQVDGSLDGSFFLLCSGTFWLHLISVISIIYFATKRKVEDIQPTGGTVVLSFLRLEHLHLLTGTKVTMRHYNMKSQ